ncbi:hypothetical protein Tco_1174304 [Tanacetum coccineum]
MVGTLMYLTTSRPDLTFVVCMCAQYQAKPIEKHLHAIKRIFKYLRGTVNKGLWYPRGSSIALTRYADADSTFLFIKEKVEIGVVELYFVNTEYQLADIFTKALGRERIDFSYQQGRESRSFTPETLKQLHMNEAIVVVVPPHLASIEENGVNRPKKYFELSVTEALQADCDIKATNIILQGLPPEALIHWLAIIKSPRTLERIQLLMQGTSLTKQKGMKLLYDSISLLKEGNHFVKFY